MKVVILTEYSRVCVVNEYSLKGCVKDNCLKDEPPGHFR